MDKKLRIKLKAFSVEPLKTAVEMILNAANETGIAEKTSVVLQNCLMKEQE